MSEDKVINLDNKSRYKNNTSASAKQVIENNSPKVFCSFCGRSEDEVLKMVKGPGANICSECTMVAVQYLIIKDKMISEDAQKILDTFWNHSRV